MVSTLSKFEKEGRELTHGDMEMIKRTELGPNSENILSSVFLQGENKLFCHSTFLSSQLKDGGSLFDFILRDTLGINELMCE